MRDATQLIDLQIEAYVSRDIEAFVALYEPDAICFELPSGRIIARGHAEIRSVWQANFDLGPRQFTLRNRIVEGQFVIDYEHVVFTQSEHSVNAIAIYRVGNDAISHVWFPADR